LIGRARIFASVTTQSAPSVRGDVTIYLMKIHKITPLLAGLVLGTGFAAHSSAASTKTSENVTVEFQDPENFTDVRDSHTNLTSTADLNELRDYVQRIAAPHLDAGTKLTVTFIDVDLAGMIRQDKDNIRIMTATTFPRAHLKFQLAGADGTIIKEGERKLTDLDYQQSARLIGRDDPLFYDKQMLRDWITKEFKRNS
jgi:Protein of unknown function (DUF3016)